MVFEVIGMVAMAEAEKIEEEGGLGPNLGVYSWLEEAKAED